MLFQKVNGTAQTGVLTEAEAVVLGLTASRRGDAAGDRQLVGYPTYGERGDRVKAMQQSLIAAGHQRAGRSGRRVRLEHGRCDHGVPAPRRTAGDRQDRRPDRRQARSGGGSGARALRAASGISLAAFPVQGQCWFGDTWKAPRGGGRLHEGLDVIAPEGKQIYAVVDGVISKQYSTTPARCPATGSGSRCPTARTSRTCT